MEHPSSVEHHQNPPYDQPSHSISIEKDSPLYQLLRKEDLEVNSYHNQAVKKLAPSLKCMAASEGGIVEAVYMPEKKYVWTIQWHPEFAL